MDELAVEKPPSVARLLQNLRRHRRSRRGVQNHRQARLLRDRDRVPHLARGNLELRQEDVPGTQHFPSTHAAQLLLRVHRRVGARADADLVLSSRVHDHGRASRARRARSARREVRRVHARVRERVLEHRAEGVVADRADELHDDVEDVDERARHRDAVPPAPRHRARARRVRALPSRRERVRRREDGHARRGEDRRAHREVDVRGAEDDDGGRRRGRRLIIRAVLYKRMSGWS